MPLATVVDAHRSGIQVIHKSCPEIKQKDRIIEALGLLGEHLPSIDEETLSRYYKYLTAKLSFPFTAYYPEPTTTLEEVRYRCTVVKLLDPANDICDEVGGIFCKTRKEMDEIDLPLIELEIPQDSPNFQFIEDYWYWFWNWR
jgi:hypothetical protein